MWWLELAPAVKVLVSLWSAPCRVHCVRHVGHIEGVSQIFLLVGVIRRPHNHGNATVAVECNVAAGTRPHSICWQGVHQNSTMCRLACFSLISEQILLMKKKIHYKRIFLAYASIKIHPVVTFDPSEISLGYVSMTHEMVQVSAG